MRHRLHLKNEEPASIAGSIDMRVGALRLCVDRCAIYLCNKWPSANQLARRKTTTRSKKMNSPARGAMEAKAPLRYGRPNGFLTSHESLSKPGERQETTLRRCPDRGRGRLRRRRQTRSANRRMVANRSPYDRGWISRPIQALVQVAPRRRLRQQNRLHHLDGQSATRGA